MPITIDSSQVNDFLAMVKNDHGAFRAECGAKPRKYRLYFIKREALRNDLSSIRNTVPTGTRATPVPSGVPADKFKKLIDDLAAAEKLLREEEKKVPRSVPTPDPIPVPYVDTKSKTKQRSRRKEARDKLKRLLKTIYGEKAGKARYKFYEKLAKEAGQEGSPSTMWGFFNGATVEERREIVATRTSAAPGGSTEAAGLIAPTDAAVTGATEGQAQGGLMAMLWPTDKPIYARPAAIGGALLVAGVVGWMLLSTPSKPAPKPAPKPAEKKAEAK